METRTFRLKHVLVVVERRPNLAESYSGLDLRHTEDALQYTGMAENISVFSYYDYPPNCDEVLINYCLKEKPQAILLSLQNITIRPQGAPTPECIARITHELGIPTVAFWWDIWVDEVAAMMERYLHAVTLNMILGVDARYHKPMPLEGTNYVYAGITFDERLFGFPEGVRDIPVGLLGPLAPYRIRWLTGLRRCGIKVLTTGGPGFYNLSYADYLGYTSRMKIVLNFSPLNEVSYEGADLLARERVSVALDSPVLKITRPYRALKLIASSWRNPAPALEQIIAFFRKPPASPKYHEVRGRVWEALWCRTFLLEGENPATTLYFEPYADYVPFTTLKDLVDKIRYYLAHDEERDRIRLHGRATVEKYHNARIHWENLFEAIGLVPGGQADHHPGEIWDKAHFDRWYSKHPSEINKA